MKERTIRELGGEIWSEINTKIRHKDKFFEDMNIDTENALVELVMQTLARYEGFTIINDEDFPVPPLPFSKNQVDDESDEINHP